MKLNLIAAILGVTISGSALAGTAIAQVTDVTAENMPTWVAFQLSGSPCGAYLTFQKDPQTNEAAYGMLLSAIMSGGSVWVEFGSDCKVSNLHGVQVPPDDNSDEGRRRLLRKAAVTVVRFLIWGL
jgi:hypothetical protein